SLRGGSQMRLIESALRLFRESDERHLASGPISRILVHFKRCDERQAERDLIRQAFATVFDGANCCFLNYERDQLEIGQAVSYQSLVQYLREDGPYHSSHRSRIEIVQRHLQQEVGRYENHHFFVRPVLVEGGIPQIEFVYTGEYRDRKVEAFVEGYTEEKPIYIEPAAFRTQRATFVELKDYERASRRFGGVWVLQRDIVRLLLPQQVAVLYLFFDEQLFPEVERAFTWEQLYERQRMSPHIPAASRNSQTFLDMLLEGLALTRFIVREGDTYQLGPGFDQYQHVTFYQLGDYSKRHR
ncbi:MAG: hypothetical protein KC492_30600, partial [Myxococcales bacterium]|nr:hypothetical protein [Myxococcales bacterium]